MKLVLLWIYLHFFEDGAGGRRKVMKTPKYLSASIFCVNFGV